MMKRFILGISILFLFLSCQSLSTPNKVEQLPEQTLPAVHIFQGMGDDFSSAASDLFSRIEEQLGFELDERYLTELITTRGIDELGLIITNERSEDGSITLLARAQESVMLEAQRTLQAQQEARDYLIEALIKEANLAYKVNDDTKTIALYLEAAQIAREGSVGERKHRFEVLVDEAISYIGALRFVITRSDPSTARTTVTLRRRSRLLAPRVLNAPIAATYEARNPLGEEYVDTLFFNSLSGGQLLFTPLNAAMKQEGEIVFSLHLAVPDLGAEVNERINFALAQVTIPFAYALKSSSEVIDLALSEYSITGDLLSTTVASKTFVERARDDGMVLNPIFLDRGSDDDVDEMLQRLNAPNRIVIIGSVGVLSVDHALGEDIVVVSGSVLLYDQSRRVVLYDSKDIEAVGWGTGQGEAMAKAFEHFGSIAEYLIRTAL
ncbi:MAG: hypothetical protein WC954_07500 [Sphaerochaeta sp.]